jgi:hypothetical protein
MGRVSSRRKARDPAFELLERGHFFFDDPTMVWRRQHSASFCWDQSPRPNSSLRRRGHSPWLMALGELHGRNLASALMRSCVHDRTRDRGGKPIRLAWPRAFPPVLPKDRGRSLHSSCAIDPSCREFSLALLGRKLWPRKSMWRQCSNTAVHS